MMNLSYDFRTLPYETLVACVPPGFRLACSPVAMGVNALPYRVCPEDALTGVKGGVVQGAVGLHPHVLTTNFNSKIQYMVRSRLDRGQRVTRTVRCDACDITLNSEQQAKQHYKGKFHQRKLRQQTQKSPGTEDPVDPVDPEDPGAPDSEQVLSAGIKRTCDEVTDESSNRATKLCRREDETENLDENLNSNQSNATTVAAETDVKTAPEETEMASPTSRQNEDKDASRDSVTLSESKVIQVNKNRKQLEISIEMKNTYHNSSSKLVTGPLSLPGLTSPFAPMTGQGLPRGVLVAPQSIVPSFSLRPAIIPCQSSTWLPQTIHFQSPGYHHNVAFNPTVLCANQTSMRPVFTGIPTVPQRIVEGHSHLQPQIGIPFPAAVVGLEKPTQDESMAKSIQWNAESITTKKCDSGSCSQNEVKPTSLNRRPDLTQMVGSSGPICSSVLEQLDPVSRAVYSNFLGYFSKNKSKSRSSQGRHR